MTLTQYLTQKGHKAAIEGRFYMQVEGVEQARVEPNSFELLCWGAARSREKEESSTK